MGAYSLDTLVRKWGRGELTVEQVVGQILLNLQNLQDTVAGLERRVYSSAGPSTSPSTSSGRRSGGPTGRRRWPPQDNEDNGEDRS